MAPFCEPGMSARETRPNIGGIHLGPGQVRALQGGAGDGFYHQFLFLYGTALAMGLHIALVMFALVRSLPEALFIVGVTLVYATLALALWQFVLPRFADYPLWRRVICQFTVTVLAFAALSLTMVELRALVVGGASILKPYEGGPKTVTIPVEAIRRGPIVYALIPILPASLLCVVGFNQHFWRLFLLRGRQVALQELAVSAQLAALRAQVNPHFLFNSLNSIAQLITTDPAKAEACVERLGEIYRYLLHRAHADFTPLDDELKVAEAYLEIERARFGESLEIDEQIDPRARSMMLPSLILQPLVENAVKHGISPKLGGGRVTIEARVDNGDLRLAIRDTGVGIADEQRLFERGVGLRNVRDRLLHLYGIEYAPQIRSRPGAGTTVSLRIPVAAGHA
jgi:signal transduction histidine kinase